LHKKSGHNPPNDAPARPAASMVPQPITTHRTPTCPEIHPIRMPPRPELAHLLPRAPQRSGVVKQSLTATEDVSTLMPVLGGYHGTTRTRRCQDARCRNAGIGLRPASSPHRSNEEATMDAAPRCRHQSVSISLPLAGPLVAFLLLVAIAW
jgi:hypothetical protein